MSPPARAQLAEPMTPAAQITLELRLSVRNGFAPPPELSVSEFSDDELIVTTGPLSGTHWQTDFAPYQRGILDVFDEPGVEIAVIMGSSQWGKTACAVNVIAYHIAHDPCPILKVAPTEDPMAKDFSRNRLEPVIEASPALSAVVSKRRSRNSANTTLLKTFRGGAIAIGGANSAASLAARPVRLLILDEIDRYPPELPGEGSTIAIAIKRTQTYGRRRRIMMFSSPTIIDGAIHAWHGRGDRRQFHVPCPDCGAMNPYEWKNIRWENDSEGNPDSSTALIHCPDCDHGMNDAERIAQLQFGTWVAEPGRELRIDKSIVSFHVWEAYSPMSSLSRIVSAFLQARKNQKQGDNREMHTWQNTTLGEPVEPDPGDGVESDILLVRRENYGDGIAVPEAACLVTMGVDTQDDRLELLVIAWGPGEESWIIDRDTLPGDTSQPGPWEMLDEVLGMEYLHATGQRLPISGTCIDSAGHRTTMVYDYAMRQAARRVYATIGRDGDRPIVSSPSPRRWGQNKRKVPLYTIGVDSAKSLLMSRLVLTEHGPGYVHLPLADWADAELAAQLTSEVLVTRWHRGVPRRMWKKRRPRNEMLDCAVLNIAALRLLHPDLDLIHERLTDPEAGTPSSPAPEMTSPKREKWINRRRGKGRWLRR